VQQTFRLRLGAEVTTVGTRVTRECYARFREAEGGNCFGLLPQRFPKSAGYSTAMNVGSLDV